MRVTRAGEYAVRCVLFLSGRGCGDVVSRREVARVMKIPDQFLSKIAQQLARSGIIEILQGSRGGFRLLRSPSDLTLLDVVEAVMGEIYLNDCLLRPRSCVKSDTCAVRGVWDKARRQLRATLRAASFASLLERGSLGATPVKRKK